MKPKKVVEAHILCAFFMRLHVALIFFIYYIHILVKFTIGFL